MPGMTESTDKRKREACTDSCATRIACQPSHERLYVHTDFEAVSQFMAVVTKIGSELVPACTSSSLLRP
jgi:hypothetical protein